MTDWISEQTWTTIVQSMPIPSVDLVVNTGEGIVLAKRTNEPAKGEWFVPGGRIQKDEPVKDAVHRIAQSELNIDVTIVESLGTFDHFYDVADVQDTSKHYIAHGFVVKTEDNPELGDNQHKNIRVFKERPQDCHEYVADYLDSSKIISI